MAGVTVKERVMTRTTRNETNMHLRLDRHMIASLVAIVATSAGLALAAGCTTSEESVVPSPAPPAETIVPPAATVPRTLLEKPTFSTSPVNLLLDPNFSLTSDQGASGAFLAFYEN